RDARSRRDVERCVRREVEREPERRRGALVLEPGGVERAAGPEQRELTLQQVVFADLAHLETARVQAIQRVVHGRVLDGVVERYARRVHVRSEERRVGKECRSTGIESVLELDSLY